MAMLTIEQCKAHAAEYKTCGKNPNNSDRKSSVLVSISHSLTALAHQLESLAAIVKDERN
jgi:hypothetical protein